MVAMASVHRPVGAAGWLLDEVATAGRENLDHGHVARYDAKEDADAAGEVELCRDLGLSLGAVVVDAGAGTGQFSLAAAPFCARVVAVDVSPVMVERLHANVESKRLSNVEIVEAGFLSYRHQGQPADLVYSRYALHHLPDFWKAVALARLRQLLRPQGVLRLWDVVYHFEPADAGSRLEAWCSTADTEDRQTSWDRAELEEHVRDEHSTFTWLLEPMMERVGFSIEAADYSDDGIFAKYILRRS